mmetsp:Transcript_12023/g.17247  ORF Transcript_12023/g.17247 Transcript_12023/m.17247 type:complete len:200 (+) Transcript_12023:383-982(+)
MSSILVFDSGFVAMTSIISSTFSAAYFSATFETSDLSALIFTGLTPAAFRSKNSCHFSECLELVDTSDLAEDRFLSSPLPLLPGRFGFDTAAFIAIASRYDVRAPKPSPDDRLTVDRLSLASLGVLCLVRFPLELLPELADLCFGVYGDSASLSSSVIVSGRPSKEGGTFFCVEVRGLLGVDPAGFDLRNSKCADGTAS